MLFLALPPTFVLSSHAHIFSFGQLLSDDIDSIPNPADAIHSFSKHRAVESKKLVQISRELDRPGALGFFTFILPIILDAIFHKLLPKVFGPNVITLLQRESMTFSQVARKKRIDRLLQVVLLGGTGMGVYLGWRKLSPLLFKLVGSHPNVVAVLFAGVVTAKVLPKVLPLLQPGMAPADVMNVGRKKQDT